MLFTMQYEPAAMLLDHWIHKSRVMLTMLAASAFAKKSLKMQWPLHAMVLIGVQGTSASTGLAIWHCICQFSNLSIPWLQLSYLEPLLDSMMCQPSAAQGVSQSTPCCMHA